MTLDDTTHPNNQNQTVVIHLLGAFCVHVGDREVPSVAWRLRKAAQLVKLLALTPCHMLHREQVCDLLWPDLDPEAAYNNLRYALHVARRALDGPNAPTTLLPMRQQLIALHAPGALIIDAEAFEAAAARCRDDPALYHAALTLYPGDLLPEDRYEAWAEARRVALRATYHALCMMGAQWHEARGEFVAAIPLLQRVVADEPLHEEACVALMRTHAQLGQRTEALAAYVRLRNGLARELAAAPTAASQRLYTAILAERILSLYQAITEALEFPHD